MNPREEGFLLLTSHLGVWNRKPLTIAQLLVLAEAVRQADRTQLDRSVTAEDVMAMGFNRPSAEHVVALLSQQTLLRQYVSNARKVGCTPVTRVSDNYPLILRKRLKMDSPGTLWAKGDLRILAKPGISLVGSRDLAESNLLFAGEVGTQAARQGLVLISGNARGADRVAQDSCLAAGGQVISIVADRLHSHPPAKNVLYLSEDSFDLDFTTQRALRRNRIIHSLGLITLVAQCADGRGGTWSGTQQNLRNHLSPVFCFDDGTATPALLEQMGARRIGTEALQDLKKLIDQ